MSASRAQSAAIVRRPRCSSPSRCCAPRCLWEPRRAVDWPGPAWRSMQDAAPPWPTRVAPRPSRTSAHRRWAVWPASLACRTSEFDLRARSPRSTRKARRPPESSRHCRRRTRCFAAPHPARATQTSHRIASSLTPPRHHGPGDNRFRAASSRPFRRCALRSRSLGGSHESCPHPH